MKEGKCSFFFSFLFLFLVSFFFPFKSSFNFLSFKQVFADETFKTNEELNKELSKKLDSNFILLKADSIEKQDEKRNVFYLTGKVEISFGKYFISCERAEINFDTYEIEAERNVVFKFSNHEILARKLFFNYSTLLGNLYDVQFQSGRFSLKGKEMEKVSEQEYLLKRANFTFCKGCSPLLSFSSPKVKVHVNDYVKATHPIARIYQKPFFYFPFISYPLNNSKNPLNNSKKRSGFLFPKLDIIDLEFIFSQGLFLSLSDHQNITLTGKYYSKRGSKLHTQYEYKFDTNRYGIFKGALIDDQLFNPSRTSKSDAPLKKHANPRGFFQYQQKFLLPFQWMQRMNINRMTDLDYNKDYPDEVGFHGDSALENQISFARNFEFQHIHFETGWYTNLIKGNPLEKNEDAVHRIPEINYSLLSRQIASTPFYYNLNLNYVHFFRRKSSYDNVVIGEDESRFIQEGKSDGFFNFYSLEEKTKNSSSDPNHIDFADQIRTGHRFIFQPKLFYFFSLFNKLSFTSSLTYKDRFYLFNIPKDELDYSIPAFDTSHQKKLQPNRTSRLQINSNKDSLSHLKLKEYSNFARQRNLNMSFSMKTKFYKVFQFLDHKYKHVFEPEISFYDTLWFKTSKHHFFGDFDTLPFSQRLIPVSNTDFFSQRKGIQFDYEDRVYDHTFVKLLFTNKIIQKYIKNGQIKYRTLFFTRTQQSYDLSQSSNIRSQAWSPMNNFFQLSLNRLHIQHIWDYFPYVNVHHLNSRVQLDWSKNQWIGFSYQKTFVIKEDNTYNFDERTENFISSAGFTSQYLDLEGHAIYSLVDQSFQRWSYVLIFKPPGDCVQFKFQQVKEVGVKKPYFTFKLNLNI